MKKDEDAPAAAPAALTRPGNVLAACAVACVLAVLAVAQSMWAVALHRLVIDGAIALIWLGAAAGIGAALLRLARVNFGSLALRVATAAALGLGVISLLMLGAGVAGLLHRAVAVSIVGLGVILCGSWLISITKRNLRIDATPQAWLWLLPAVSLGIALVCALVPPGILWGDEPNGYDVVGYHLQVPREWYEAGRIVPLTHNVFSFFPFNVEMHYLLAMLLRGGPWQGMYLAQLMHVGFIVMTVLAVYGVLEELDSPHPTIAAVAAASVPWMTLLGAVAYNEGGLLLFGALAVGLMIVAAKSASPVRIATIAGALAGFACGTKLTAVPMVLFPVALLSPFCLRRSEGLKRHAFVAAAVFLITGVVTFSPWVIRNLAWTGNPFFPHATDSFGRAHFSETQVERWERAHSPREDQREVRARFVAFYKQVLSDWRFGFLLLPIAVAAIIVEFRRREMWFPAGLLVVLAVLWLLVTHLQGRFLVLSIPIGAFAIGLVRNRTAGRAMAVIVVVSSLLGLGMIGARVIKLHQAVQLAAMEDLSIITPLSQRALRPGERVILVGDARAFLYQIPMSQLAYRTVFDVDADEGDTAVDAWMRGVEIIPGGTLVVIDPFELRRFARTYWMIPPLPPDMAEREEPLLLSR
jgi:hypothetical protein